MARSRKVADELAKQPPWVIVVVLLIIGVVYFVSQRGDNPPTPDGQSPVAVAPGEYVFAFWNVGNFYDDLDDPKLKDDMEDWFPYDSAALQLKLDRLSEAILRMNDERGPDILAMVEVESDRSLELLQQAIAARCDAAGRPELKYPYRLFRPDHTGRRFAPAILSRVPVDNNRTRKVGGTSNGRMLVGRLEANGQELIIFPAHWTSRVTDKTGARRMSYAEAMYGEYREIVTANPSADVIVCGDFNDDFTEPSLQKGLHAVDRAIALERANPPGVWDLCARFDLSQQGTLAYRGKWNVFDHICISPGLLDKRGWTCDPDSISIFHFPAMQTGRMGSPKDFGDAKTPPGQRGYSDHFPVLVKLRLLGG